MPKIISIEGNIGAGKTTILSKLQEHYADGDIVFLREPVDVWEKISDAAGENILQKFYRDPAKYAYPFQVVAFITRYSAIADAVRKYPNCRLIVCERSLDADYNIFAKMLADDGIIEDICFKIYTKIYQEFSDMFPVQGIVYVDADAEVCAERISRRARDGESEIALDYLAKCKKYHDEWLLSENLGKSLLHLKTNEEATYEGEDCGNQWIRKIREFIE